MNPFTERYKILSDFELVKIISTPSDYQQIAVEAAKIEISKRRLTEAELANLKSEIEYQQNKEINTKQVYEDKLKDMVSSITDSISPISNTKPSIDKIILITSLVYFLLSLYHIFDQFKLIKFMLTSNDAIWGFEMIIYFILLLVPLVGSFLFWQRKNSGWVLLGAFVIYSALNTLLILLKQQYRIPAIDNLFPSVSLVSLFMILVFHSAFSCILLKKGVRLVYNINRNALILTSIFVVALTWLTISF